MSETSHTSRALPALFSEFGGFGFRLSCSDPVPDKFQVSNPLGSFRGLSRGVCLASLYTLYTPRPAFLPPQAWSSQRLLYTVVQVHQIPLHILTVYLFPNAVVGSHKYMLNCEVISWAVQVADSVQAPVLITGDFNISWRAFDLLRDMVGRGWNDLHELASQRFDSPLSPTCKGATRHSFQFANSELSRFLTGMQVSHSEDLDSHAVLIGSFDLPVFNPAVWRWSLPRSFDDCELNQAALSLAEVPPQACSAIDQALESDDVTTAFREWSKCAEHAIYMSAAVDGQCPGKKYLGRSSRPAPIKRQLAAPRFKSGRPTDFRVQEPSVALRVRQVQKQARRLQTMERLMRKALHPCSAGIIGEVHHVWRSVVSSPGFGRSFAGWVVTQAHLTWADCPSISQVVAMKTAVMKHAQSCAAYAWNRKKLLFNEQVEKSWTTQGGALPFRLVKEPRKPPVTDLTIQIPVRLAPQRWNPVGRSWFKVLNPQDFPDQCELSGLDVPCKVVGRADNAIQVDRMLSRREAATLYREFVSADPAVWSDHFLEQWGQFWNRDTVDQDSINQVVAALPRISMMDFPPLTLEDWKQSLRSAKRRTMRGADGWSVQELLWLPDHITMTLLRIFHHLSTWVLVLLRKTDDPCPVWSAVRPITIAGVTYRLWSRVRTAQFMRHARSIAKPLVAPCLSTRAIWTFLGDLISRKVAAKSPLAGLVLDIVKAFNILDRGLLRAVMVRLGFNVVVVTAVMKHAQSCAAYAWNRKKLLFNEQVEKSWTTQGGALPFRLVKEPRKPPVTDLTIQIPVRLAPQRWNPVGKSWFKVLNPQDFPDQCELSGLDVPCKVVGRADNAIQVDRMLSRREAATLYREFVSADPAVWSDHFLEQWGQIWNRDTVDQDSINQVVAALPRISMMDFPPLTLEDWKQSLRSAKRRTMRGADGWSVQELLWLPDHITMHARSIAKPLVAPCLSTRAIWTFLGDLISRKVAAKSPLAGLVLDIVKAFNILDRGLLRAVMVRLGFNVVVVDAWLAMLQHMLRTVLMDGTVHGSAPSVVGIPEGDPLSVIRMFCFAKAFDHYLQASCHSVLCITYSDNWEVVARSARELLNVLPVVEQFLDLCQLLVAPGKCWLWAICGKGRQVLRQARLFHQTVPIKLQARELGADISYCLRKAAKERNVRAVSGLKRMARLHGLPGSTAKKTRVLVSGILPHALHAAESSLAPKTVLQRLRSGAANAIGCRSKGASPWLSCLLATYRCVDPEFVLLVNRLQLFRQVIKELPDLSDFFLDNLSLRSSRPGPSRLLVEALSQNGWVFVGDGIFSDVEGRIFHVCLTPPDHVVALLLSTWSDRVASQVRHRKYLFELPNVSVALSRPGRQLLAFERKLILQQQIGAFFSGELLVEALSQNGWVFVGDGIFSDVEGRIFHVCLTPPDHVVALLLSTWSDRVASQVRHRKYLFELPNVSVALSRPGRQLLAFERKLILQQQIGAFFSGEYTKNIDADAAVCRHCGQPDSRLHRLKDCPFSANWRAMFPSLLACWDALPEYMTAFGLAPEPEGWRAWQAQLDTLHLPDIARSNDDIIQVFYTDGACLHPRDATVRIAAGAVLKATSGGSFDIVWCGILPGSCQSIFRAELLAVSCAFFRSTSPLVFTDSKSVARIAQRILRDLRLGRSPCLPSDHRDLWAFFLTAARGTNLDNAQVHWIKGHVDYRKATGLARLHAWYNHWADLAAKRALKGHFTPLYKAVVQDFQRLRLVQSLG
eukprot:s90_g14.t1